MLVLNRFEGQQIMIGDDVTVTIIGTSGNRVRVGIDAPQHVAVNRKEIWLRMQQEKEAEAGVCERCHGEKQIANTASGERWSLWEQLPPGSDAAVKLGLVKPIPCPACCPADPASHDGEAA